MSSLSFNAKKRWDQTKESKNSDIKIEATDKSDNSDEPTETSLKKFRKSFRFNLFGRDHHHHAQRHQLKNSNSGQMQISRKKMKLFT